jgi:hypothetical protein
MAGMFDGYGGFGGWLASLIADLTGIRSHPQKLNRRAYLAYLTRERVGGPAALYIVRLAIWSTDPDRIKHAIECAHDQPWCASVADLGEPVLFYPWIRDEICPDPGSRGQVFLCEIILNTLDNPCSFHPLFLCKIRDENLGIRDTELNRVVDPY